MNTQMIVISVIVGLGLVWTIGSKIYSQSLEAPAYTVLEKKDGYEVRQYQPMIVAQVTLPESDKVMNDGFMQVAGYIFGDNTNAENESGTIAMTIPVLETSTQIKMTAPVLDTQTNNERTIAFVLPSKWTLETLPTPNNENVIIQEVPAQTFAVARFFEPYRGKNKKSAQEKLTQKLISSEIKITGAPSFAYYDPPSTPFFIRTNEVLIPIEHKESQE